MSTPYPAICIGHSRRVHGHHEGGAISWDDKVSEWTYNSDLGLRIKGELAKAGIVAIVISDYEGNGYSSAQRWLAARLKALGCTLALELHFNSSDDPNSNGHEQLYWNSSKNGKRLADEIRAEMCLGIPEIKTRGIKEKFALDRGAEFLKGTHCPAVICESGFGSSKSDWNALTTRKDALARAITNGVLSYLD